MRSAVIKFDGTEYTIPAFNLRQLRDVSAIAVATQGDQAAAAEMPFKVLAVAMQRAIPPYDGDVLDLTPDDGNLNVILGTIMRLAGLVAEGEAQPGTETAAA